MLIKNKSNRASIFLLGFMGAGKTTVGRALSEKIDYGFIDLDELIESHTGKSIREIFAELGEEEFRRIEKAALKSCAVIGRKVISLGGGAYIAEENRNMIAIAGVSVWLECPLEVCLSRISSDGVRPLLRSESEVRSLYEDRLPYYKLANYKVDSAEKSPDEVADQIIDLVAVSE